MSKLTFNELSNSLNDFIDSKQDSQSYSLNTENKTIVGAINEIYGKEIIANAIGEPLDCRDTFTEMNNDINGLLNIFKVNMMNNGVAIDANDKFKQLIDKITELKNGNSGIQFASGNCDVETAVIDQFGNTRTYVKSELDFKPNIILIRNGVSYDVGFYNDFIDDIFFTTYTRNGTTYSTNYPASYDNGYVNETGFKLSTGLFNTDSVFHAIGVGEDSIAGEKPLEMEFTLNDLVSIQYETVDNEGFRYDATALGIKLNLGYIPSRMMVYSLDTPWKGYTYMSYNSTDESKTIIHSSIGNYFQYMHVMVTSYFNTNLITEDQINLPIYWNAGGTASKPTSEYRFKLIIYK